MRERLSAVRKATGMTRWGVLAGVTATLVLAGCDVPQPGAAVPDPAVLRAIANAPVSAATAFGPDESTVDPCSIVNVHKLDFNLNAAQEPADAFDDCPVSVTQTDGTKVDVSVGPLETEADQPDIQVKRIAALPKGMTLSTQTPSTPGFCDDYLTFADGVRLAVLASAHDVTSKADVCPAAEALARNAADAIRAGSVKHVRYPAGSVGKLDPCTLVPDSALAAIGLSGVSPTPFPQHHECTWRAPGGYDAGSLHVLFDIGTAPKVTDATLDSMSQIAGRTTLTTKVDTFCYVQTGLRTYGTGDLVEIALVDTHAGSAIADACGAGQTIATTVWPQLPNTG
jgi:hypothetical protein